MRHAAVSMTIFTLYVFVLAIVLMFVPNWFVRTSGLPTIEGPYIRIAGLLAFNIGVYYATAIFQGNRGFYNVSVFVRLLEPVWLLILVLIYRIPSLLIAAGAVNAVFGLWTGLALWLSRPRRPQAVELEDVEV